MHIDPTYQHLNEILDAISDSVNSKERAPLRMASSNFDQIQSNVDYLNSRFLLYLSQSFQLAGVLASQFLTRKGEALDRRENLARKRL